MKIEFEEKDIKRIDGINEDIANNQSPILFVNEVGKNYYINFECVDIAKANNFIWMLMTENKDIKKEIEDKFGIKINSINYCEGDNKLHTLKAYLKRFLDELEFM